MRFFAVDVSEASRAATVVSNIAIFCFEKPNTSNAAAGGTGDRFLTGETLDVRFVGNGRETAREVALQNEKLQHAIEAHLPAGAMPHLVKPGEHHEATTSSSGTKSVSDTVDKVIERVESGAKQLAADVASWKPDMSFEHFEKLMTRARGGIGTGNAR